MDQRFLELEERLIWELHDHLDQTRQTHLPATSDQRSGIGRAEIYALILGVAIVLLWFRMPKSPLPPAALVGPPENSIQTPLEPLTPKSVAVPEVKMDPALESLRRKRMPPDYLTLGDWPSSWSLFVEKNPLVLTVWLRKASKADGLDRGRLAPGQGTRLERFAQALLDGDPLTEPDLDLVRQGLFEYLVALWVEERGRADRIRIDLDRRDISSDLMSSLLEDLDLAMELFTQDPEDSSLQAAVVRTWIWQQWGK